MRLTLALFTFWSLMGLAACKSKSAPVESSPPAPESQREESEKPAVENPAPAAPPSSQATPVAPVAPSAACPAGYKQIRLTPEYWVEKWGGPSAVIFDERDESIVLKPEAAAAGETRSVLVHSRADYRYFKALITYTNIGSTRVKSPQNAANPWEVFWLFFNLTFDSNGDKLTNYFIAKPEGSELGRASLKVDQSFVKTSMLASAQRGEEITLKVNRDSWIFTANTGGLLNFRYSPFRMQLYDDAGKIGLYSEDAEVRISKFCIGPPEKY